MDSTELEEYQEFVSKCPQPVSDTFKPYWAASQMSCEALEVLEIFEKGYRKNKEVDTNHLIDEMGDVLWGIACICNYYRISLDDVILNNISKLSERHNATKKA